MLKVTMLQTPGIELDGKPVSLPFKRADALLYYMLVCRSATRQELIALLWENRDEAAGLRNLRNTLYTLKKALGGDLLLSPQKSLVVVNEGWELECDYDRFTREKDFSVYRGPFLQGFGVKQAFSFDEWLNRTRETLHGQYLGHLAEQARLAGDAGDQEEAIRYATEYLREDPLDEPMASFLMEQFRTARKFSHAAQTYQKLKQTLSDELGAAPMESTTMLYYEIMNQWNDIQTAGAEEKPAVPVGREAAYTALRAAVSSFGEGVARRCSLLLTGEAGSGKSELVTCLLRQPELGSMLVLRFACRQSEADVPLSSWDCLLPPLREVVQSEQLPFPLPAQARLQKEFPGLWQRDGLEDLSLRVLRRWDQSLEDSVLQLLSAVALRKRVLLVWEDVQWADPESLRLMEGLLRRASNGRFMAVLTSRDTLSTRSRTALERLEGDGFLRRQRLRALTEGETRVFLERELDGQAAERLSPRFYRETGGNLALLTELTQAYRCLGNVEDTLQALSGLLLERLDRLSGQAMGIAQLISLFPEGVPYRMLLELSGQDGRGLANALAELRDQGVIEELRSGQDACFRFVHRRVREQVYSRQPAYRLQPLHLRAAELLSGGAPPRESAGCREIARHFRLAQEPLRALKYRVLALELDTARRCEPFSMEGGFSGGLTDPEALEEEAQSCLRELSLLRRAGRDAGQLARLEQQLLLPQGRLALHRGEFGQAGELLGSLSGAAQRPEDGVLTACCYLLASLALYRQDARMAERYVITGRKLLEHGGAPVRQAQFQRLRGDCFCLQADYEKSLYYYHESLDTLERQPQFSGVRLQSAAAYCGLGQLHSRRKDYVAACTAFKKALELPEGERCLGVAWICLHYGRTANVLEDHTKARELFARGLEEARATGSLWGRAGCAAYLACYQAKAGLYSQAAQALADAQETARRVGSPLESGILAYAGMYIRRLLELARMGDSPLEPLLPYSSDSYARQGVRLLEGLPDVFEFGLMSRALRDGITSQVRYRSSELYSRNKNFMSE